MIFTVVAYTSATPLLLPTHQCCMRDRYSIPCLRRNVHCAQEEQFVRVSVSKYDTWRLLLNLSHVYTTYTLCLYRFHLLMCICLPTGRSEGRIGRSESGSGASESTQSFSCSNRRYLTLRSTRPSVAQVHILQAPPGAAVPYLSAKLSEWICENMQDEFRIPDKQDPVKWSVS